MKVLLLELSNRCDAGCPWCIQKYMKRERGEMELKLVERIADMTEGQKDILWLHFNGESFNHPQLFEAIEIMAKRNIKLGLFTNGMFLTDKIAEKLVRSSLYEMVVTVTRFDVRKKVKKLFDNSKRKFKLCTAYLIVPSKMKPALSLGEYRSWCMKNHIPLETRRFFPAEFKGDKHGCELVDLEKKCALRLRDIVCVYYDGTLVSCVKDYDGLTAMGNIKDFTKKEFQELKYNQSEIICPYL